MICWCELVAWNPLLTLTDRVSLVHSIEPKRLSLIKLLGCEHQLVEIYVVIFCLLLSFVWLHRLLLDRIKFGLVLYIGRAINMLVFILILVLYGDVFLIYMFIAIIQTLHLHHDYFRITRYWYSIKPHRFNALKIFYMSFMLIFALAVMREKRDLIILMVTFWVIRTVDHHAKPIHLLREFIGLEQIIYRQWLSSDWCNLDLFILFLLSMCLDIYRSNLIRILFVTMIDFLVTSSRAN